jgi:hypothetical protein
LRPLYRKTTFVTIILLLSIISVAHPVFADQASATAAINSAKDTLVRCYEDAKDAESAGANITLLTDTLNSAGQLLSQAEAAYAQDNFDVALNLAVQSQTTLNGFSSKAETLGLAALQQRNNDFIINVVGSIIATLLVLIAGLAAWSYVKKKYATDEAK